MGWPERAERLATAVAARVGEPITYTDGDGTETEITAIVSRVEGPVLIAGQVQIMEGHWRCQVPTAALAVAPEIADTITARGATYAVDYPPELSDGMWTLTLRPTT